MPTSESTIQKKYRYKLLAIMTIIMALSLALLPNLSHAEDGSDIEDEEASSGSVPSLLSLEDEYNTVSARITVPDYISIEKYIDEDSGIYSNIDFGTLTTGGDKVERMAAVNVLYNSNAYHLTFGPTSGYTSSLLGYYNGELNGSSIPTANGTPSSSTPHFAFKLSNSSSDIVTTYNDYKAIPDNPITILSRNHKLDLDTGDRTVFTFAVAAPSNQLAGIYSTSLTITASGGLGGLEGYVLNFHANGGTLAANTTNPYTGIKGTTAITLPPNPTRTNYTFLGWCINDPDTTCTTTSTNYLAPERTGTSYIPTISGAIDIYAKWELDGYIISYDLNGDNSSYTGGGAGTMPSTEIATIGNAYTIPSTWPTRTGYGFLGWSTSNTATTPTYKRGASIANVTGDTTLYAVWKKVDKGFGGVYVLQDLTSSLCSSAGTTKGALMDVRDGKIYQVNKLADGKCWMIQNLALGSTTDTIRLTPSDTNILSTHLSNVLDANSPRGYYDLPKTKTTGYQFSDANYSLAEIAQGSHTDNAADQARTIESDYTTGNTGNWYSWIAATAGTGADTTSTNMITRNTNVNNSDICPKNWQLPSSGAIKTTSGNTNVNSDFERLVKSYISNWTPSDADTDYVVKSKFSNAASSFTNAFQSSSRVGIYHDGSLVSSSSNGDGHSFWWSRTIASAGNAFFLDEDSVNIMINNNFRRYYGYSIRCVTK